VPAVQAMQRFTQGPIRMELRDGRVLLTDLRMGQEPHYSFVFDLGTPAQLDAGQTQPHKVSAVLSSGFSLSALIDRILGRDLRAPATTAHP
jgi:inner membrane protein